MSATHRRRAREAHAAVAFPAGIERREWQGGRIVMLRGDCREILPTLHKIDVLVSDPPYGIAYVHSGGGQGRTTDGLGGTIVQQKVAIHTRPIFGDDAPFDPAHLFGVAPRILLWGADHFRARLPEGGRFIAWDKSVGVGPHDTFTDCEFAWTNVLATKRNVFRYLWKGFSRTRCALDLCVGGSSRRGHVTQKPVALMRWCIEALRCPPDGVVLDPYAGVGSTGIAAITLGLRFVGIEIDPEHFAAACARIDAAIESGGRAA